MSFAERHYAFILKFELLLHVSFNIAVTCFLLFRVLYQFVIWAYNSSLHVFTPPFQKISSNKTFGRTEFHIKILAYLNIFFN